jgi:fatty acid desaturase
MRAFRRSDEMHKRIITDAFAMAAIIFGWLLVIWGFAENGGAPHIPMVFIAPLLVGIWGLCIPVVLRRYR